MEDKERPAEETYSNPELERSVKVLHEKRFKIAYPLMQLIAESEHDSIIRRPRFYLPDVNIHIDDLLEKCKDNPKLKEESETRVLKMFNALIELNPSLQEVDGFDKNSDESMKKAVEILKKPEVLKDLRILNFVLNTRIIDIWMQTSNENYTYFLQAIKDRSLSSALYSRNEMVREHEIYYKEDTAWGMLDLLCRKEDDSVNPNANIADAMKQVDQKYGQEDLLKTSYKSTPDT